MTSNISAEINGVLRKNHKNPRYFTDNSGKSIYLTGSHTWANLLDGFQTSGRGADPAPAFDYLEYVDTLKKCNHNFIRLWAQELPKIYSKEDPFWPGSFYPSPSPWQRSGKDKANDGKPKFDLSKLNQSYFDRLRKRIIEAKERGIYVCIMLFEGYMTRMMPAEKGWNFSPYHKDNNINGINGDPDGDGYGSEAHTLLVPEIVKVQEAYIKKVIDTVNDLDNVLYEISNEEGNLKGGDTTADWQYHHMNFIRKYEKTLPKQHPVGISCIYAQDNNTGDNTWLTESTADWIAPWGPRTLNDNPPAVYGEKVIFADTDHIYGVGGGFDWVWKVFMRGYNPIYMDPWSDNYKTPPELNYSRETAIPAMGATLAFAKKMDLTLMIPDRRLSSTKYCLTNPGYEYLVYQPTDGIFDLRLPGKTFAFEWTDPKTGNLLSSGNITAVEGKNSFTPPRSGPAVLYLVRK